MTTDGEDRLSDWFVEAERALGEEPPAPDAPTVVWSAFKDRVLANALRIGLLEKVTYPGPVEGLRSATTGEEVTIQPGEGAFVIDGGQMILAVVSDSETLPPDPFDPGT